MQVDPYLKDLGNISWIRRNINWSWKFSTRINLQVAAAKSKIKYLMKMRCCVLKQGYLSKRNLHYLRETVQAAKLSGGMYCMKGVWRHKDSDHPTTYRNNTQAIDWSVYRCKRCVEQGHIIRECDKNPNASGLGCLKAYRRKSRIKTASGYKK